MLQADATVSLTDSSSYCIAPDEEEVLAEAETASDNETITTESEESLE